MTIARGILVCLALGTALACAGAVVGVLVAVDYVRGGR